MGASLSQNCCGSRDKESDSARSYHSLEAPPLSTQSFTEAYSYSATPPLKRKCCRYGDACSRGNPNHFVEETHPGDPDHDQGGDAVVAPAVEAGPLLPARQPKFDWVRTSNTQEDRLMRAETASLTLKVCRGHGYQLNGVVVPLKRIDALLEGTKILTLDEISRHLPLSSGWLKPPKPKLRVSRAATALDAALQTLKEGNAGAGGAVKVAVLNAASAYHPCGGFRTGGRHALEESMCVQSSLCVSLQRAVFLSRHGNAQVSPPARVRQDWFCYIPEQGAVLSPGVEVFRLGSNRGYEFLPVPGELTAVVSVAMPNKNPEVKDSPMDAPVDPKEYKALLVSKFRAALGAAAMAGAPKCVVPGVGTGVFRNDAGDVGSALAEAIQWPALHGRLEEVILAGVPRNFALAAGAPGA